jgi:hypothetical protein
VTTSHRMSGRWCRTDRPYTLWEIGQFAQIGERERQQSMTCLLPTPIDQIKIFRKLLLTIDRLEVCGKYG